jgi:hypothetical protein
MKMKKRLFNRLKIVSAIALGSFIAIGAAGLTSCATSEAYALVVDSEPVKVNYKVGDAFTSEGLSVVAKKVVDGYLLNDGAVAIDEFTTSIKDGDVLSEKGEITVVVSTADYGSTSFKITVGDNITTKKLVVVSTPNVTSYTIGQKFSTSGLLVYEWTFVDGEVTEKKKASSFTTNPEAGTVLDTEGSFMVSVDEEGFESTTFSISVLTKDETLKNIFNTLIESKNYQIEIYNTISTTVNSYGFHYKETFTENYFDKVTYKKSAADEAEDVRGRKKESEEGYVNYSKGVYGYSISSSQEIVPSKPVSSKTNRWDADVAIGFSSFDISDVPTTTKNGKFSVEIVLDQSEKEANQGSSSGDWTNSLKKNAFAATFLDLCGWSSSLISIMSRIDFTTDGTSTLFMKAYFGTYGYTSVELTGLNGAKVDLVEEYMANDSRTFDTSIDSNIMKEDGSMPIKNVLYANNYTNDMGSLSLTDGSTVAIGNVLYTSDGLFFDYSAQMKSLYGNYYEDGMADAGYFFLAEAKTIGETEYASGVYYFETDATGEAIDTSTIKKYAEYADRFTTSYDEVTVAGMIDDTLSYSYASGFLDDAFDTDTENGGKAFTRFTYTRFSTATSPFIVTYDSDVIATVGGYLLGISKEQFKKSYGSTLTIGALAPTLDDEGNINNLEIWVLTSAYSGYRVSLFDFGTTATPAYISALYA